MTLRLGDREAPVFLGARCPTVVFFSSLVSRIRPNETAARAFNEVDARPRGEGSLSENPSRCAVRPRYRWIE
jgi:hypothetical protein